MTTTFLQTTAWLDFWTNQAVASVLLAHSIDRFIVVVDSIFYYAKQRIIVCSLIVFVIATSTAITTAVVIREFILPDRFVDRMCL